MELRWRPGANHQLPVAHSRLPIGYTPEMDVDDSFPDDSWTRNTYRGRRGPVLDEVLLSELGADGVDTCAWKNAVVVARSIFTPGGAAVDDDHSEIASAAGEACGIAPVAGGSAADAKTRPR